MRLAITLAWLLVASSASAQPQAMLWVWHGAHDLRGLPSSVGVAYLARTVRVHDDGAIAVLPRHEAVLLDDATTRWGVVRVELDRGADAADLTRAIEAIGAQAAVVAAEPHVAAVQIDFDAPHSMHAAYAALLTRVRGALAPTQRLSMTALGSWCTTDRWLADAPVDVVVPMLFGPGHDTASTRAVLASDRVLPEPRCREAIGVREGEALVGATTFVFAQGPWTLARARAALPSIAW